MKSLKLVEQKTEASNQGTTAAATPVIVRILDIPEPAMARVALPDGTERPARMTATVSARPAAALLGREALAVFEANDPDRPILLDVVGPAEGFADEIGLQVDEDEDLDARVDGREVIIRAEQRLELRCGKASIIIDADGKISIKGAQLYNRAIGPIRIKGGHVDIN